MPPLVEQPCRVHNDRDPNECLQVIQQLKDERQRNVATIAPHLCSNRDKRNRSITRPDRSGPMRFNC